MKDFDAFLTEAWDERNNRIVDGYCVKLGHSQPGTLEFFKILRDLIDHCARSEDDRRIKQDLDKAYTALRGAISKV